MEVGEMKRKFKIEKDMVDRLDEYSYEEKVKYAAILKILQEDGLTEDGTHEELLAQNGAYAALYKAQFK